MHYLMHNVAIIWKRMKFKRKIFDTMGGNDGRGFALIGDVVFFHFAPQGRAIDLKRWGGLAFIPVMFAQRI